jgi:glycosyltransferase involved in cell wall biosynthesis
MTRIFFDATSLDAAPSGAKSRLLRLAPELAERGHEIVVASPVRLDVPGTSWVRAHRGGPFARWLRPAALADAVRQARSDVVVFETLPPPRLPVRTIALIHDLRHVQAGGLRRVVATAWLRDAARRAACFHVPSEAVRAELSDLVPEARGRIDVVPNAVVVPEDPGAEPLPPGLSRPFVFAAGHSEPRKDWLLVARLASGLAASGIQVVRAGRGREAQPNVLDLGIVSDALRDSLFHHAAAILAPARLEGFGLVPLEALACGAWVVASDIPAHHEVLASAADFFAPGDAAAASASILAASRASPLDRATRAAAARSRAAAYAPSTAADAFEASLAR